MTRHQWTTPEQLDWLKERVSAFIDTQADKTTMKTFFPQVLKDWASKWPLPPLTADEITKFASAEEAIKKQKTKSDERIKAWFHNHTRNPTSGAGTRGLLKMTGQTRLRQEWQVYQLMTYESKWKSIIDNEWETYKSNWGKEHPGDAKPPQGRFAFMNSFLKEKYENESEDVKKSVQARRAAMKSNLEAENKQNEAYQSAIDKLPRTLAVMGESIRKQTGWFATFLVGGPEPRQNGKLMTYVLHCGKTAEGEDFEGFLGEDAYEEHIMDAYDDFLNKAFPAQTRLERSLGSKVSTPKAGGQRDNERRDEKGAETGDEAPSESEDVGSVAYKGGKSEYELSREANMAKNRELLREVEERFPMEGFKKAERAKSGPERVTRKEKAQPEQRRTSERLQPRQGTTKQAGNVLEDCDGLTKSATGNGAETAESVASVRDVSETGTDLDSESAPTTSTPLSPVGSESDPSTPDATISTPATSPTTTTASTTTAVTPAALANNTNGADTPPISQLPAPSMSTKEGKRDLDLDGPMDVDGNDETGGPMIAPPAWLAKTSMPDYLRGITKEKAWQELVSSLFRFETLNTTTGNLQTVSRPDEVAAWIKSKKKDSPPEVDPDTFGSAFMAWWIAIQPQWRVSDDASFVYEVPIGEDWRHLHKGGSAGLYTVVVALSWWIRVLPTTLPPCRRAWAAVQDVHWVINQIYTKVAHTTQGTKRGRDDGTLQATLPGKAKRCRSD